MNRLREAEHTSDDVDMLKRRLIDQADKIPKDAICLFTTNKKVDDHNDIAYNASPTQKCIILSFDIVIGDVCQAVKLKAKARIPTQSSKTMGLLTNLPVTVGLQYEICINVVVEDGLTNGTSCVEKYFRVPCSWPAKVQHNMVRVSKMCC